MASTAIATTSASTGTERYLEAERSLWEHYGLEPEARFVDLDAPSARLRVLEVGSGEPCSSSTARSGRADGRR